MIGHTRTPASVLVTCPLSCGTLHGHEGVVNGTASLELVSPTPPTVW